MCSVLWYGGAALPAEEQEIASAPAKESVQHIQIPEGTQLELVASEPQIMDPIAIRFDEFGRMWVAQMGDYPEGNGKSSIRILEDLDNFLVDFGTHFEGVTFAPRAWAVFVEV